MDLESKSKFFKDFKYKSTTAGLDVNIVDFDNEIINFMMDSLKQGSVLLFYFGINNYFKNSSKNIDEGLKKEVEEINQDPSLKRDKSLKLNKDERKKEKKPYKKRKSSRGNR